VSGPARPAILSVHDVTPEVLPAVREMVELVAEPALAGPDLLVVPGSGWEERTLDELRTLVAAGCSLAGHGWSHRALPPETLHHRLHAAVLSRDRAEHLSRRRGELRRLVERCHRWFASSGLPSPTLYVPPAWALGPLGPDDLRELPFNWYERLDGFVHARSGRVVRLPLIGFEADTVGRKVGLRAFNAANDALAAMTGRPLRIALHPRDLSLLLASDARAALRRDWRAVSLSDLLPEPDADAVGRGTPAENEARERPTAEVAGRATEE